VLAEPELLRRHVPLGWRKCAEVVGAAALFAASGIAGSGCGERAPAAIVAPLFEHGEGRGATGCVVVSPPVFLSEEEALQVVSEELAPLGVAFSQKGTKPRDLDAVDPKHKVAVEFVSEKDYYAFGGERSNSTVQSYDFKRIAAAVPAAAPKGVEGMYLGVFYDPMARADFRRARSENEKDWERSWRETQQQARAEAKDLLRRQVRDFAAWLKAQGAI
jgi:hypothetical protein